jgi:hypothetical protein
MNCVGHLLFMNAISYADKIRTVVAPNGYHYSLLILLVTATCPTFLVLRNEEWTSNALVR